jgi:AraC-like DNA-binding protein
VEALEHLARYAGTANEALHLEISQHQGETIVTLRPIDGHDEPRRQFSEFIALAVIRALNRATNRDFAPSRMTFAHPRNLGLREIHRILRCPVQFAQTTDSWVLPQRVIELPIASGDSHLLHILEAHANDLLSERRTAKGPRGLVENRLLSMLPSGKVKTAAIAHQFGMSARSFTRHLAQEGTSFGKSSTVCATASLFVISKIRIPHSNRLPGCSAIRRSERSTTPSNGGPGHRLAEREIRQRYRGPRDRRRPRLGDHRSATFLNARSVESYQVPAMLLRGMSKSLSATLPRVERKSDLAG